MKDNEKGNIDDENQNIPNDNTPLKLNKGYFSRQDEM